MKLENFDYHFKIRKSHEQALNLAVIYKNLAYGNFDKSKLSNIFKFDVEIFSTEGYLSKLTQMIGNSIEKQEDKLNQICVTLQNRWANYRNEYINIISKALDVDFKTDIINHLYCYLQLTPINELDLVDDSIYLNANKNEDEIFKSFIILLTKKLLLNRWRLYTEWDFNTDFDSKNKMFMFADIAIDAIFSNTELSKICKNPSYKYFYNITNEGENVMDQFSKLYKTTKLNDFFDKVYMFVYRNYQNLLQFKHYLY